MPIDPAAIARKGRSKPDAAVERLVRKYLRFYRHAKPTEVNLRAIITEARQSAARECAEIAEHEATSAKGLPKTLAGLQRRDAVVKAARKIRRAFNLEGK